MKDGTRTAARTSGAWELPPLDTRMLLLLVTAKLALHLATAAVAVALILSPERRELAKPWIWIGLAIALLLFLPNVLWQIRHGFPTIEDLRNVRESGKNVVLSPVEFVKQQILFLQLGWPELVADVAKIYRSLPPEERAKTGIFASNYGEAGALNLFGPALGLPPPICAHQNHYFWGPPKVEPENLIWLQWGRRGVEDHCRSVEKAGEHFHPWGMAEENRPIYLCRGLRQPLAAYWTPDFKHWN